VALALTAFLVGVLAVSVVAFLVMGLRQSRRTRALARAAHGSGFRFAQDDPFDLPQRYARFAVIGCGHSVRACNVMYGRVGGWAVRAFDLGFELGHGTRRIVRKCRATVLETDVSLPRAWLWRLDMLGFIPHLVWLQHGRAGPWAYGGAQQHAMDLANLCSPLLETAIGLEACGTVLMVCEPFSGRDDLPLSGLMQMPSVIDAMRKYTDAGSARYEPGPAKRGLGDLLGAEIEKPPTVR